jgi:alpha-ketoglutarate-dependent taurine dioxygenase
VFGDDVFMRWRTDTIVKGLEGDPSAATADVIEALTLVQSLLDETPAEHRALLTKDSVCVVDNHLVLHGRTRFDDHERHLIRIRFHATHPRSIQ